jgi:hypothetical protein
VPTVRSPRVSPGRLRHRQVRHQAVALELRQRSIGAAGGEVPGLHLSVGRPLGVSPTGNGISSMGYLGMEYHQWYIIVNWY